MISVSQNTFQFVMRTSSQDSEYVKIADEAWQEALEIARSTEDWKEEKNNKDTVSVKYYEVN